MAELTTVNEDQLREELPQVEEHLARFGDRLPRPVRDQLAALKERLG
jgi:phosphoenolpyruvate carboxykinase (GTP)